MSNLAKDLISGFLQSDPEKRLSIDDALLHPWFREYRSKSTKTIIDKQSILSENIGIESTTRGVSY